MTTDNQNNSILPIKVQERIVQYLGSILDARRRFTDLTAKLTSVDIAYAYYQAQQTKDIPPATGVDIQQQLPVNDAAIPIVASQVDTVVAHLVDVFLGKPKLFEVIGSADHIKAASTFETLVNYHAQINTYGRQLQLLFRDAAKVNLCALETSWEEQEELGSLDANSLIVGRQPSGVQASVLQEEVQYATRIKRIDLYNLIVDYRVPPSDVSAKGEFAGYVELMSRTAFKMLLNKYSRARQHMNVVKAEKILVRQSNGRYNTQDYQFHPQVSRYLNSTEFLQGGTYMDFLAGNEESPHTSMGYGIVGDMYEVSTFYVRVIPKLLGIKAPKASTPQIWKFQMVGRDYLIYAAPVVTAYDQLPILVGQLIEDGLGYQTKGIGESQIPFQTLATDLFKARMASSRRALSDRALYDPTMINSDDVNTKTPAAKIPVRNLGLGKSLRDAYHPLPFEDNSVMHTLTDINTTIQMSQMMYGINSFAQGQTQKGNRTLGEFNRINAGSSSRLRVFSLMVEYQIMQPLRAMIKVNILRHNLQLIAIDPVQGELQEVSPAELLTSILEFKVSDGFSPRESSGDVQALQAAFMTLQNLPRLQAEYDIGKLFAHLMQSVGVRDVLQYQVSAEDKQAIIAKAMPFLNEMLAMVQPQGGASNANQS